MHGQIGHAFGHRWTAYQARRVCSDRSGGNLWSLDLFAANETSGTRIRWPHEGYLSPL